MQLSLEPSSLTWFQTLKYLVERFSGIPKATALNKTKALAQLP